MTGTADVILALLQWDPYAPGIGQGRTDTTSCPTIRSHR